MKRVAILGLLFLGILFGRPEAALADGFSFTTVNVPGATTTYADGINNQGQIVGVSQDASGAPHGFVDTSGAFTTIDPPYGPLDNSYYGIGINDRGQIVGATNIIDPTGHYVGSTGFVESGGVFTTISGPNGVAVQPLGINDRGQIIGFYSGGSGTNGFVDTGGVFTTIQDPSATGGASIPFGINNKGQIVGWFDEGATTHGYLYCNGVFLTIKDPLAPDATFDYGINDNGQIVGSFADATGWHGFVDTGGVFTTINAPGGTAVGVGTFVYGINDSGDIVGTVGSNSFLATPVATPEPSTLSLLVTSLIGFAMFARRKLKSSAVK